MGKFHNKGKTPVVCGGWYSEFEDLFDNDSCYVYNPGKSIDYLNIMYK